MKKNNELRNFVYNLDSQLQAQTYIDRLPIFEMDDDGIISADRVGNTFDIITELVSEGTELASSGLNITANNPHLMFCLNNTMNYVYVSSQRIIPILTEDNELKFEAQASYVYALIACTGVGLALILAFIFWIERKFMRDRGHFINIFTTLNERTIQQHLNQVKDFISTLDRMHSETKHSNIRVPTDTYKAYQLPAKDKSAKQIKKIPLTKGINVILIMLFIYCLIFLCVLFSAYPVLIIYINAKSSAVLTKMKLMSQSNENLLNVNFLMSTLYEYIQENGSTNMRNEPISQAWQETYNDVVKIQQFLIIDLLGSQDNQDSNSDLYQVIMGNICDALPPSDENLVSMCKTIGSGASLRGLEGLTSYVLDTARAVKDFYDGSMGTTNDKMVALSNRDLVNLEVFYSFILNAFSWLNDFIKSQIITGFSDFEGAITNIMAIYLACYILFGIAASGKITTRLENEINDWRKMLIQVPYPVIIESKLIKAYLVRTSGGLLKNS